MAANFIGNKILSDSKKNSKESSRRTISTKHIDWIFFLLILFTSWMLLEAVSVSFFSYNVWLYIIIFI
ncbi:unnamed protein product, partial [Vitis vinifera]|uniref:Uncharacterized protein n=1 Tax=Vitis vinifera TaxID=29760 RepID=D7U7Y7_VITVI